MEIKCKDLKNSPVPFSDVPIGAMFLYNGRIFGRSEQFGRSLGSTCHSVPQDALCQIVEIESITVVDANPDPQE